MRNKTAGERQTENQNPYDFLLLIKAELENMLLREKSKWVSSHSTREVGSLPRHSWRSKKHVFHVGTHIPYKRRTREAGAALARAYSVRISQLEVNSEVH